MQRLVAALAILLPIALAADPAPAQSEPPRCVAERAGQLSCQAGVACVCRFFRESLLDTTPAGWRWDCGALRPRCAPPTADGSADRPVQVPGGIVIEQVRPDTGLR